VADFIRAAMNNTLDILSTQWQQQSGLEVIAFVLAVLYVVLAAKQNIVCWICAFVSTSIYVFLFYEVALPFQSLLNLFYIVMAVYGFVKWRQGATDVNSQLAVSSLGIKTHLGIIIGCLTVSFLLVLSASSWFDSSLLALDVLVTVFSVAATVMTARKIIDNWIYWFVINIAAMYLLIYTHLYLTALLMCIYTFMAVYGWLQWRKSYKEAMMLKRDSLLS